MKIIKLTQISLAILFFIQMNSFAQLADVEGDVRVSYDRPTIELFDSGADNRVESLFKVLGDDTYIQSTSGKLCLGVRNDGQTTLTPQLYIRKSGINDHAYVGINIPTPGYALHIRSPLYGEQSIGVDPHGIKFQSTTTANLLPDISIHRAWQELRILNHQIPNSQYTQTMLMGAVDTSDSFITAIVMDGIGDIGIGQSFFPGHPEASVHLQHRLSTTDPRKDGIKFENDGANQYYFTAYVVNATNDLELYTGQSTNPVGRFDAVSGAYSALSDARVKEDIHPIEDALDKISNLNPVSYKFKHDSIQKKRTFGLIAQEMGEVFPELVEKSNKVDVHLVDYSGLIPWLIKAMQELQDDLQAQKSTVLQNNEVIEAQSKYIELLESKIKKLENKS